MTDRGLLPLRVPARWAVLFNNFVEIDLESASPSERSRYLSQDLLSIAEVALDGEVWRCPNDGYVLDVGWYETKAGGEYRLHVLRGDWDHQVAVLHDRDREVIRRALERAMLLLHEAGGDVDLQRQLAALSG